MAAAKPEPAGGERETERSAGQGEEE